MRRNEPPERAALRVAESSGSGRGLSFGAAVARARRWLPLIGGSSVLGTLSMLALPLVLAETVDAAVAGRGVAAPMAAAAGLVIVSAACELVDAFAGAACTAATTAWLRRGMVRHVLALDPHRLRRFDTGDLTARVSANCADAARAGPAAVGAATGLLPSIGSLAMLAYLDWWLAAAFIAGLALVAVVLRVFTSRTTAAVAAYQRIQGAIAARLSEALAGRRTIAAAGTVERERHRVLAELPRLREHGVETWRVLAATGAQSALVGPLTTVGVLLAAGLALSSGRLSPGEMLASAQYAMSGAGIGALTGVFATLARSRAGVRRLSEVTGVPVAEYGELDLPDGDGRLEFRAVSVEGPLDGVDLILPGGTVAAVVGASGAGKSVLAELAAGLRAPDAGEVLLDGVPLRRLRREALRRAVAWAPERPVLVGATVADAIAPGRSPRPAARAADAHDFIRRLPRGYGTPLDQAPMSGGEAQRIGLARAWHAERLLVLDDATSSLDTVTERRIVDALTAPEAARTRLLVTHRAATAARAELVVWLEAGRVRAVGPHERLWAESPAYREVFA
ncbi:ABC transporter transmembrane domain-containing protein [Glycomyces xiaoerkulensis]|uniref:ABC transporter transmembrane domain-containing protein n=1 Tax=Glycomyces xiaoerkulensis TaxID=2038139 RepID=UPI001E3BC289|nr:ABC transporter ATP-binding protein [Glycomyces xiaoerkulensis]